MADAPFSARYLTLSSRPKVKRRLITLCSDSEAPIEQNTKIRLIIVFPAKDGEVLNNQQKQDQELTVVQTMNSLLPNSDLH